MLSKSNFRKKTLDTYFNYNIVKLPRWKSDFCARTVAQRTTPSVYRNHTQSRPFSRQRLRGQLFALLRFPRPIFCDVSRYECRIVFPVSAVARVFQFSAVKACYPAHDRAETRESSTEWWQSDINDRRHVYWDRSNVFFVIRHGRNRRGILV